VLRHSHSRRCSIAWACRHGREQKTIGRPFERDLQAANGLPQCLQGSGGLQTIRSVRVKNGSFSPVSRTLRSDKQLILFALLFDTAIQLEAGRS
jgi:hypothetical protein